MNSYTSASKKKLFRILIYTIISLLIFISVDRGMFYILRNFVINWYNSNLVRTIDDNLKNSGPADIIIMGTSRAYRAINPKLLEKLENKKVRMEAFAGRNIKYNYFFYKKYREHFPPPEYVIYGTDYFMFNSYSRSDALLSLGVLKMGKSFFNSKENSGDSSILFGKISLLFKMKPQFDEFLVNFLNFLNKKFIYSSSFKWKKVTKIISNSQKPPKWHKFSYRMSPGPEGKYLIKLLDRLSKDKVKVLILTLPDYIGTYESQIQKKIYLKDLKHLTRQYNNIRILDFNRPEKFHLENSKLFFNGGWGKVSSHLNVSGANKFTIKLHKGLTI